MKEEEVEAFKKSIKFRGLSKGSKVIVKLEKEVVYTETV